MSRLVGDREIKDFCKGTGIFVALTIFSLVIFYAFGGQPWVISVGLVVIAAIMAILWRTALNIKGTWMLMLDVYIAGLSVGGVAGFLFIYLVNPKLETLTYILLLIALGIWSFWDMKRSLGDSKHQGNTESG